MTITKDIPDVIIEAFDGEDEGCSSCAECEDIEDWKCPQSTHATFCEKCHHCVVSHAVGRVKGLWD